MRLLVLIVVVSVGYSLTAIVSERAADIIVVPCIAVMLVPAILHIVESERDRVRRHHRGGTVPS